MVSEVFISYSWWAVLLVLATGLFYAGILYFKNPLNKLSKLLTVLLFVTRFVVVSLLAFLLLSPYLKTKSKIVERPIMIIGVDNSSSLLLSSDSAYFRTRLDDELLKLRSTLSDKCDVDIITFGEEINEYDSLSFDESLSDYSAFFSYIKETYSGQNVGAVLIAGDGITNSGVDPVSAASDLNWPIYSIALGDTIGSADVKISDVRFNSFVYKNDVFPIEVSLAAKNLIDKNITIRLYENGKEILSQKAKIKSNNWNEDLIFTLKASEKGKRRFRVVIDNLDSESVLLNNSRDIFIDVLETRLKILLLSAAPHPDVGAIKECLERNPNFDLELEYVKNNKRDYLKYDVIVLYQLPSVIGQTNRIISDIAKSNVPILYFFGNQSSYIEFNRLSDGLKIKSSGITENSFAMLNEGFTKFTFSEEYTSQLQSLPPLVVPISNYSMSDGLDVFAWQNISEITTDFPLISYYSGIENRMAYFIGEGIWLWRIQSMVMFNNTNAIDALLSKTVMYLQADNDKRRFKVITDDIYDSRKDVILRAEYYNEAMEPDNMSDISMELINEEGKKYNYDFSPYENNYMADLNKLPTGVYKYRASVSNTSLFDVGEFIVRSIDYESRNTIANYGLMQRLVTSNNGKIFHKDQFDELGEELTNLPTVKSKIHFHDTFTGLNTILFVMIILMLLLTIEWFTRKYFGSY